MKASRNRALKTVRKSQHNEFASVTLRGEEFKIGDAVKVKIENEEEGIATIVGIFHTQLRQIKLKVRWYYSPSEVGVRGPFLSQAEVFDSKTIGVIPIETVIEKATVLTLEEYNNLDEADDCTFFCRASYDGKKLKPPLSQWAQMCVCRQIVNPDRPMTLCENCWLYFHSDCIGFPFVCPICRQ